MELSFAVFGQPTAMRNYSLIQPSSISLEVLVRKQKKCSLVQQMVTETDVIPKSCLLDFPLTVPREAFPY